MSFPHLLPPLEYIICDFIDMGTSGCRQATDDEEVRRIQIPGQEQPMVLFGSQMIRKENEPGFISQAQRSMSRIIFKQKAMKFSVLNCAFQPVEMIVNLSKQKKSLKEHQDKDNRFSIHCVEIGDKQQGMVNLSILKTNTLSAIAFAGTYRGKRKERGVYFFITPTQAFMFQGEFGDKESTGLKVTIAQGMREKVWGTFNSKFQANGRGTLQAFYENDGLCQEHIFEGTFVNGVKEGQGMLRIRQSQAKMDDILSQKPIDNEKIRGIKDILVKNSSSNYKPLTSILMDILANSAMYNPAKAEKGKDSEYRTIFKAQWRKNVIEGLAFESWPKLNFRFQGMYKDNQRNGYGEEYADDQPVAMGFYRNGEMEKDKDNDEQLMGLRYNSISEQWRREKE